MARDIAEIRNDIHETRERLRVTAEAIGWKADVPARARDVVRETVAVVRGRVAEGSNAPPVSGDGPGIGERIGNAASSVSGGASSMKEKVQHGAEAVGDRARQAADAVSDRASSAKDSMSERAASAKDSMAQGGDGIGERMPSADDARQAARGTLHKAASNPVGVAMGALVLGAIAGAMLPATRTEQERVAPVAQDLREKGEEFGHRAVQEGERMAEQGREAAQSAASSMDDDSL